MMNANVAREAAPKTAPMATNANAPAERCADGITLSSAMANTPPSAALDMNIGASRPPDVPDPSEITKAMALANITISSNFKPRFAFKMSPMVSYPTPSTRGTKYPMIPSPSAPMAGHQSSSTGKCSNRSSVQYSNRVKPTAASPQITPSSKYKGSARGMLKSIAATLNI